MDSPHCSLADSNNKKLVSSSESPLKISRTNTVDTFNDFGCDSYGFQVTDNNGLSYSFNTQDRSRYDYYYGYPHLAQMEDSVWYASSWHLSKVTDLCGNTVTYTYSADREIPKSARTSHSKVVRGFNTEQMQKKEPQTLSSNKDVIYYPKVIKTITSGSITVRFNYFTYKFENKLVPLIGSITVSDKNGDTRTFSLNYKSASVPLLLSVKDQGKTILEFDYDNSGRDNWPFDYSKQDFGGYSNNNNTGSLVPTVTNVGDDADRTVSPAEAKKCALTRITYPTGGYTDLEWESNTFNYVGPVEFKGGVNTGTSVLSVKTDTLRMCLDENYRKLAIRDWVVGQNNDITLDLREYFCMNPAILFQTEYEDDHSHYLENYSDSNQHLYPHVRFKKHGENKYCNIYFLDKSTIEGHDGPISFYLPRGTYDIELVYPTEIQGAKEDIERNMRYGDSQAGKIYIHSSVIVQSGGEDNHNNLWCGLRIRRITSSAGDGEEPIRKDFYYNAFLDPSMTSGTIHMLPQYINNYSVFYTQETGYEGDSSYQGAGVVCVGSTAFPNSLFGNYSSIEYPEISTCLSRKDRLYPDAYLHYMTEKYYYSSVRESGNRDFNKTDFLGYQPVGERMNTSMAHRRGNLMKKAVGNLFSSIAQITSYRYNIYESSIWDDPDITVLTTSAFTLCDMTRAPGWNLYGGHDYSIGKYIMVPYTKTVASETVEETDGIIAEKNYEYFYDGYTDKLDYGLVKSVSSTTSEGNAVSTHFTYAYDEESRMILPEKETEVTVVDGTVIGAVRNEYDPTTRLLLRKYELPANASVSDLLSTNQRTTDKQRENISTLTYEYRYNSNGNLVEIKYKGIPLVSYLWGYNGLYPVIEAAGVSYDRLCSGLLAAGVTQQQIDGRSVDSQTQIRTISDSLRASVPEATVSSIAYHWLLGIIEMTDGAGHSTTYDYDNRGRLVEVRDFNNYLIQKYTYNTYGYGTN